MKLSIPGYLKLYKILLQTQIISILILFIQANNFSLLPVGQLLISYVIFNNFKNFTNQTIESQKYFFNPSNAQIIITIIFSCIFYLKGERFSCIMLYLIEFGLFYLILNFVMPKGKG